MRVLESLDQWGRCAPEQVALLADDTRVTFGELLKDSTSIAHTLRSHGAGTNRPVALYGTQGAGRLAALIGIMRSGAPCLALDPQDPPTRMLRILGEAGVQHIVLAGALDLPPELATFSVFSFAAVRNEHDGPVYLPPLPGADLAYVIGTSGSTGIPKAVAVGHESLAALIEWQIGRSALPIGARTLHVASPSFDVSYQEIFSTLAAGGVLVLVPDSIRRAPRALIEYMASNEVARIFIPPSLLGALSAAVEDGAGVPRSLLQIICSGEPLTITPAIRHFFSRLSGATLDNQYGPSETHVASAYLLQGTPLDWPVSPPIGRPVAGRKIILCDAQGSPVPQEHAGEIYISGVGPAHEYLGRPALTEKAFVLTAAFGGEPTRAYRTGDRARLTQDGVLHFLGRADDQVKIRGYRVELGEVEAALRTAPLVLDAAVRLWDAEPRPLLAAYVALAPACQEGNWREVLQRHLEQALPAYMLPDVIEGATQLPLTTSGKLDRSLLSRPTVGAAISRCVITLDAVEEFILEQFKALLKLPHVGIGDNFMRFGGDSLSAARVLERVSAKFGVWLDLAEFERTATVTGLAQLVKSGLTTGRSAGARTSTTVSDRHAPFPLTSLQQAYLVGHDRALDLGGVSSCIYAEIDLRQIDMARARTALERLVERHGMLRAIIRSDGTQQVLAAAPGPLFNLVDFRVGDLDALPQRLMALRESICQELRAPQRWPLYTLTVALLPQDQIRLYVVFDLLIGDWRSLQILVQECRVFYEQPDAVLPPPALAFRDCVLATANNAEARMRSKAYWNRRILHPAPRLPQATQSHRLKPRFKRRQGRLESLRWTHIKLAARELGVTPTAILLTAFAEVIATWSDNPQFTLNLPTMMRTAGAVNLDDVVGEFTSVTLLSLDLTAPVCFAERAQAVQHALWSDLAHAHYSGVEVLRDSRRGGAEAEFMPIVFTSLLGLDLCEWESALLGWGAAAGFGFVRTSQTLLDHHFGEVQGALCFNWDAVEEAFPGGMLEDMFDAFCRRIAQLADKADSWQDSVRHLVPAAHLSARRALGGARAAPAFSTLDAALGEWAARYPERPAFLSRDITLSYAELQRAVGALVHTLRQAGLQPGQRAAIVMNKGWEQLAATLAILQCGAVYLPIDPVWPDARREQLLCKGETRLVLTQPLLEESLVWPAAVTRIVVQAGLANAASDARSRAAPEDLAYVIFTSGSTGEPKGVAMTHAAAVNTIHEINEVLQLQPQDRVLAVSSLTFDLSVYDLFGTILGGAALVMPSAGDLRDARALLDVMHRQEVTVWNSVPLLMEVLLSYLEKHALRLPGSLRVVMLSGDWIPVGLPERMRKVSRARLISLGGATEAGIWSVIHPIDVVENAWTSIPYGRPLPRQTGYVLDSQLESRPDWVAGSFFIGGESLAQGYWRDPERTAASFITHPASGERLYRTGDRARFRPGGILELLGREDRQLKLLGHRVEPGEIEATLARHSAVQAATVVPIGEARNARLVAFVQLREQQDPKAALGNIENYLRSLLPSAMIPSALRALDAMPLTANGKLDRAQLSRLAQTAPRAPAKTCTSRMSELVRRAIAVILGSEAFSPQASFGELGLSSLDLLRLRSEIERAIGRDIPLTAVFAHANAEALAEFLQDQTKRSVVPAVAPPAAVSAATAIRDVAVVGTACRFPGAPDGAAFWNNIRLKIDSIRRFERQELLDAAVAPSVLDRPDYVAARPVCEGAEQFDAGFFGLTAHDASQLDPQHRMLMELAWESLEDCGIAPGTLLSIGIFVGANESRYAEHFTDERHEMVEGLTRALATDRDYLATRVSYKLGLTGPSVTVQTACSTSLVAVHMACQSLLLGECDVALAGAVALQVPHETGYLWQEGSYSSRDGYCRPFDAQASGTVFGSGGGVVVLRRLQDALGSKDTVLAVIKGTAIGNDGSQKVGFTAPSVAGQARVIRAAQAAAGISSRLVGYVEAHGTATPLGDPIEVAALKLAFGEQGSRGRCALGSVKGNIGHLDTAAGIAGLIKTVFALREAVLPPSLHFERANPAIDFAASPFYVNTRLQPWPEEAPYAGVSSFGIGGTNAHVIVGPAPPLGSIVQPQPQPQCAELLTVSARDRVALSELVDRYEKWLRGPGADQPAAAIAAAAARRRAHHPYRMSVVGQSAAQFAESLSRCQGHLPQQPSVVGEGARRPVWVFSGQGGQWSGMGREWLEQSAAFAAAVAQVDRYAARTYDWSVLAVLRGEPDSASMQRSSVAQVALFALQVGLTAMWRQLGLQPVAVIGHSMGEIAAAHAAGILNLHDATHILCSHALDTDGSDSAAEAMRKELTGQHWASGEVPFYSTVSGGLQSEFDAQYWAGNLREPVRFSEAMNALQAAGHREFLEIGPREAARSHVLSRLGALYAGGFDPHWDSLYGAPTANLDLPKYPWQKQRYWTARGRSSPPAQAPIEMIGRRIRTPATNDGLFEIELGTRTDWLQGHKIAGRVTLPFAAVLNMMRAALRELAPASSHCLLTVDHELPIAFEVNHNLLVHTVVRMANGTPVAVEIFCRENAQNSEPAWHRLAAARCGDADPDENPPSLDSLCDRASQAIDVAQLLAEAAEEGIELQGAYGALEGAWRLDRTEALVCLKQTQPGGASNYHPHQLDACLFAAQLLIPGLAAGVPTVPVAVDQAQIANGSELCWASARLGAESGDATFRVDYLFYDSRRQFVGYARNVTFRVLGPSAAPQAAAWRYAIRWERVPVTVAFTPPHAERWVVLPDRGGIWQRFAAAVRAQGNLCEDFEDVQRLFAERPAQPRLRGLIDFRALDELSTHGAGVEACVRATVTLQALIHAGNVGRVPVYLLTAGAQAIHPRDGAELAQAGIWGLARSVMHEHPELRLRLIDLDPAERAACAESLLHRIDAIDSTVQSAFRRDILFAARLRPVAEVDSPPLQLATNATYLIMGGLGGVGLRLAQWLRAKGARTVVLAGRHTDSPAASRAQALNTADCRIHVRTVDVTQGDQVEALVQEIAASMPPLKGIIHCAMVLRDALFINLSPDSLREVFEPKARGALLLHRSTQHLPLDFFVLFSSVAAILGAAGQANYAAAATAMDAVAHQRRAQGQAALAINWGPWSYAGSPSEVGERGGFSSFAKITPEIGIKWLEQLLSEMQVSGVAQIGAMPFDLTAWARYCPVLGRTLLTIPERVAPVASGLGPTKLSLVDWSHFPHERRIAVLIHYLNERVAQRLRCQPETVPQDRSLPGLGFESLAIIELRNEIGEQLNIFVSPRHFISAPNIRAIAELLAGAQPDQLARTAPAHPIDEVESLSDSEVDAALQKLLADSNADEPAGSAARASVGGARGLH